MSFRTLSLVVLACVLSSCLGSETVQGYQHQVENASTDSELHLAVNRYKKRHGSRAPWTKTMQLNWVQLHALDFQKQIFALRQSEIQNSDSMDLISENLAHDLAAVEISPEALGISQAAIDSLIRNYKMQTAINGLKQSGQKQCPSAEIFDRFLRAAEENGGVVSPDAGITAQELKDLIERCYSDKPSTEPLSKDSVLLFE